MCSMRMLPPSLLAFLQLHRGIAVRQKENDIDPYSEHAVVRERIARSRQRLLFHFLDLLCSGIQHFARIRADLPRVIEWRNKHMQAATGHKIGHSPGE